MERVRAERRPRLPARLVCFPVRARFCYADWEISLLFDYDPPWEGIWVIWPQLPEDRAGAGNDHRDPRQAR
jgi:hypothetical protein